MDGILESPCHSISPSVQISLQVSWLPMDGLVPNFWCGFILIGHTRGVAALNWSVLQNEYNMFCTVFTDILGTAFCTNIKYWYCCSSSCCTWHYTYILSDFGCYLWGYTYHNSLCSFMFFIYFFSSLYVWHNKTLKCIIHHYLTKLIFSKYNILSFPRPIYLFCFTSMSSHPYYRLVFVHYYCEIDLYCNMYTFVCWIL